MGDDGAKEDQSWITPKAWKACLIIIIVMNVASTNPPWFVQLNKIYHRLWKKALFLSQICMTTEERDGVCCPGKLPTIDIDDKHGEVDDATP